MKSVTLDKWSEEMFKIFETLDNEVANTYWEKRRPANHPRLSETSSSHAVETFLREKYERRIWVQQGEADLVTKVVQGFTANHQNNISAQPKTNIQQKSQQPSIQPRPQQAPVQPQPRPQVNNINLLDTEVRQEVKAQTITSHNNYWQPQFPPAQSVNLLHQNQLVSTSHQNQIVSTPQQGFSFNSDHYSPQTQMYPQYPDFTALRRQEEEQKRIEEEEKKRKISQVMSMYQNQPPAQYSTNPNQFQPLGAIAAQKFMAENRNQAGQYQLQPQYPAQPQQNNHYWPSF